MAILVGSARIDENGRAVDGRPGDQKQIQASSDMKGEVSQQNFYVHSKGWYILRCKEELYRAKLAEAMIVACDNPNIGYSQSDRLGVVKNGVHSTVLTNADCSSLVRQCIKEATGKDVGNFSTLNEADVLEKSGLFESRRKYISQSDTPLYTGDVLVTCTKGHTVIVTKGGRAVTHNVQYYPQYKGKSSSIVQALADVGEKDTSFKHRKKIAIANDISNYKGTSDQNLNLLTLIKHGKLKKA